MLRLSSPRFPEGWRYLYSRLVRPQPCVIMAPFPDEALQDSGFWPLIELT